MAMFTPTCLPGRYRIRGQRRHGAMFAAILRNAKRSSVAYTLLMERLSPYLARRERDGKLSRCLLPSEVTDESHDEHGHFSEELVIRKVDGKFSWPSPNCSHCQMTGFLRLSSTLLPVMAYQPLDLFGQDYLGPRTEEGHRYP